ncbi:hypothetical protein ACT5DH_003807 [Vibrio alginolyticus]
MGRIDLDLMLKVGNKVCLFAFTLYLISMLIYPFIVSNFNWKYVHSVWYTWQALNVGVLAFISSVIAFNISRYNANKQTEREFIASKALLPKALSELSEYCEESSKIVVESYERGRSRKLRRDKLTSAVTPYPEFHVTVFQDCIRHAQPEVADYLANILMLLQIHHSRMQSMPSEQGSNYHYYKSCLYSLAHKQVLIDNIFDFARGIEGFERKVLNWEQYAGIYRRFSVDTDDCEDLKKFTLSQISRNT